MATPPNMPENKNHKALCFQDVILRLQSFWAGHGCVLLQPYDTEMGAGTFHPATTLRPLGPDAFRAAFVQPSRRPTDARYGNNPNRVGQHHQFQVILKPSPLNVQELYLDSLRALNIDTACHDIRFVEDDWESPTLGASGLGWEVWCDGMEVTQFTYFQQMGGIPCNPISAEITYGLERLTMQAIQKVDNVYDIDWNGAMGDLNMTYGDVFLRNEQETSAYYFDHAKTDLLFRHFKDMEDACGALITAGLAIPAYDHCIKASHIFNLLDARGVISALERQSYIARVRALAKECCGAYVRHTYHTPAPSMSLLNS